MRSFLCGEPKANPSTLRGRIAKKGGLDYYLGSMSDKSEDYSQRVALYFGRRVAKAQGINDVESKLSFAHNFAKQTIANYDPRNSTEIFQGWLGEIGRAHVLTPVINAHLECRHMIDKKKYKQN